MLTIKNERWICVFMNNFQLSDKKVQCKTMLTTHVIDML